jgi:hypothetical protein
MVDMWLLTLIVFPVLVIAENVLLFVLVLKSKIDGATHLYWRVTEVLLGFVLLLVGCKYIGIDGTIGMQWCWQLAEVFVFLFLWPGLHLLLFAAAERAPTDWEHTSRGL